MHGNRIIASAAAALLASTVISAQTLTSPMGYLTQEGPDDAYKIWMPLPLPGGTQQIVQLDNTLVGTSRPGIDALAWRRDGGVVPNLAYGSQMVDLEVRMAHADWGLVQPGTTQDLSAFVLGGFTTVFPRQAVALPDWQSVPATLPAPWDFRLPLSAQWDYDGQHALLWQMQAGSQPGYIVPVDQVATGSWIAPQSIGVGCQVSGMPGPMVLYQQLLVYAPDVYWRNAVENAPPNVPVILAVGLRDPNLDIGACTVMHSSHDVVRLLGQSSATGEVKGLLPIFLRHHPSLVGLHVWSQVFAPDAQQGPVPFAFSQGVQQIYPALRLPLVGVARGEFWSFGGWVPWQTQFKFIAGLAVITGVSAP